jgi:hypothetical protein
MYDGTFCVACKDESLLAVRARRRAAEDRGLAEEYTKEICGKDAPWIWSSTRVTRRLANDVSTSSAVSVWFRPSRQRLPLRESLW